MFVRAHVRHIDSKTRPALLLVLPANGERQRKRSHLLVSIRQLRHAASAANADHAPGQTVDQVARL
jgi:hypothetical protein